MFCIKIFKISMGMMILGFTFETSKCTDKMG